jgi:hypothetical protein
MAVGVAVAEERPCMGDGEMRQSEPTLNLRASIRALTHSPITHSPILHSAP